MVFVFLVLIKFSAFETRFFFIELNNENFFDTFLKPAHVDCSVSFKLRVFSNMITWKDRKEELVTPTERVYFFKEAYQEYISKGPNSSTAELFKSVEHGVCNFSNNIWILVEYPSQRSFQ